ncbi:MAG: hypothetical protein HRU17_17465 [Polyangiaceae bacterium]|nr:hypothetical protein [Polyangiaceae bacterium]
MRILAGAPGDIAPETLRQDEALIGPPGDVFSAACVIFHAIIGEHLFPARGNIEALAMLEDSSRRSILDGDGLCDEFRSRARRYAVNWMSWNTGS